MKKEEEWEHENNQLSIMGQFMHVSSNFEISEASKMGIRKLINTLNIKFMLEAFQLKKEKKVWVVSEVTVKATVKMVGMIIHCTTMIITL